MGLHWDSWQSHNRFIHFYCLVSHTNCVFKYRYILAYKKARKGEISNFTGISSPFEEPLNADIIVKSDVLSVQQSAEKVYQFIESKLRLRNEV